MRRTLLSLIFSSAIPLICAEDSGTSGPGEKTTGAKVKPSESDKQPDNWKIYAFGIFKGEPHIVLVDESSKKTLHLRNEPADVANKLISATFSAETKDVRIEAMIDGERRTLIQTLDEMSKLTFRDSLGSSVRSQSSGGGPTEDDRKKYEALSEVEKSKFREAIREKYTDEKFRNASEEDRRSAISGIFEKIAKEDKGGR